MILQFYESVIQASLVVDFLQETIFRLLVKSKERALRVPLLKRLLQTLASHRQHLILQGIRIVCRLHQSIYQRIRHNRTEPINQFLLDINLANVSKPHGHHGYGLRALEVLEQAVELFVESLALDYVL